MNWLWPLSQGFTWFAGTYGYDRKFIYNYDIIIKPYANLLKKDPFYWGKDAQKAFDALKSSMVTTPVLALPNFSLPFELQGDLHVAFG